MFKLAVKREKRSDKKILASFQNLIYLIVFLIFNFLSNLYYVGRLKENRTANDLKHIDICTYTSVIK